MPKGGQKIKVPVGAGGNGKILDVKEDILTISRDYTLDYTYNDILENSQICVNGSPFEFEIKYPEDISTKKTLFHKIINEGILSNFKLHENRIKGFTVRVFPPNAEGGFNPSYMKCMNGGNFIYLFPYAKKELNDIEKMLSNDLNDTVPGLDKIQASECFHFIANQGSQNFEDAVMIQKNKLYFIPFGFSQTVGFKFDNETVTVLPPIRQGGRPITINKYPSHRIIVVIQVNLTTDGLCKAISTIADIQDKVGILSIGAKGKRNKTVVDIGSKLILKKSKDDEDSEEISIMEVSKSFVRLIKGNKMILGFLTKTIAKTLGKSHPELAKKAILTINEISKVDNIEDAIKKMKDLILSDETLANVLLNFLGGDEAQEAVRKDIEVYDD